MRPEKFPSDEMVKFYLSGPVKIVELATWFGCSERHAREVLLRKLGEEEFLRIGLERGCLKRTGRRSLTVAPDVKTAIITRFSSPSGNIQLLSKEFGISDAVISRIIVQSLPADEIRHWKAMQCRFFNQNNSVRNQALSARNKSGKLKIPVESLVEEYIADPTATIHTLAAKYGCCSVTIYKRLKNALGLQYRNIWRERRSGKNSNLWRGGVHERLAKLADCPEWHKVREIARKRDEHTCQICGERDVKNVHHIIPRRLALRLRFRIANLITLCHQCHILVEPRWVELVSATEALEYYQLRILSIQKSAGLPLATPVHLRWLVNGFPAFLIHYTPAQRTADKSLLVDVLPPKTRVFQTGESHHQTKITEEQALEIISRKATSKITGRELAIEYGISQATVFNILTGKTWKHLPHKSPI